MDDKKLKLTGPVCSLPASDADRLIESGDGGAALLYIYLLRAGGSPSAEEAAAKLRLSPGEVRRAAAELKRLGLIDGGSPALPSPADETPEYTAEDIARRNREDGQFAALVKEAQQSLGRVLSTADLKTLFGIYDYIGLPADVIMELLHYCCEECRLKYGAGRTPTMRFVEKEACQWVNREIMTMEQAEDYIAARHRARDSVEGLKRTFGIRDRELTPTERKYIDDWLSLGFTEEAIALAFDRTVTNTGSLKWSYMNKIIQSWEQKGLHTPKEIEEGDGRRAPRRDSAPAPDDAGELERMKKLYDKVRNGR